MLTGFVEYIFFNKLHLIYFLHPIYNKIEVTPPRASITAWEQKIEVNKSDLIYCLAKFSPQGVYLLALGKQHAV